MADQLQYIEYLSGFKADKKYGMKSSALKALRNITGYKQFRFKCKKNHDSKLLHLKTTEDSNGYNVVERLTTSSSNAVFSIASCGTYIKLLDDKSTIGERCSDWNWNNGHGKDKMLLDHLIFIPNTAHWNIGHNGNRYECDDFIYSSISIGDAWEVYVK